MGGFLCHRGFLGEQGCCTRTDRQNSAHCPDSILFVDDNPGESANISLQLPQVHTALAHSVPPIAFSGMELGISTTNGTLV
jgi:hypothetical protein